MATRLTAAQIRQIKDIISNHMEVLGQIMVGEGKPSPALIKKLGLPKELTSLVTTAYKYGKLSILQGKDLSTMSASEVQNLMRKIQLTPAQQQSIEQIKLKAQTNIDSIGQRITSTVMNAALQSDLQMWQAIKEVIPAAIENDTPRYKVIQMLREKTGDMARDWHRVAHTELFDAKLQGEAEAILDNKSPLSSQGAETLVYKKPAPTACAKCKQLYLESDGVTPRVFKISELMANGNNYNKKQADWKPTLGTLHPNCMCTLNVKPPDTEFDSHGNLIYKPRK